MLETISVAEIGVIIAFLVTLLSGIAYLKKNLSEWVKHAVKDDFEQINEKVDGIATELCDIKENRLRDKADNARYRILRFSDELRNQKDILHTKEHFDQILSDIDEYESFCFQNPRSYPNNKATQAIASIKAIYQKCAQEGTFL